MRSLDSWHLEMVKIGCPETSVMTHQYSVRNSADDGSSQPSMCCYHTEDTYRHDYKASSPEVLRHADIS